ncbi:MAG: signal peptide peptidase SppA [Thermodesulfobacteriota bacterium]
MQKRQKDHLPQKPLLMNHYRLAAIISLLILIVGCGTTKINLFPDDTEPLQEFTLQGEEEAKILLLPVKGEISDAEREGYFRAGPSMLQEFISQLRKAEKDKNIKAVLLKVDSPGGSVTASDIMYNELVRYKQKTGAKIVVSMMDLAASGGYYISLPADYIMAHPTTVTGSVGALFFHFEIYGLMDKIGVGAGFYKSGKNKDMNSPLREATEEEKILLSNIIHNMAGRFISLVKKHRNLSPAALEEVKTARLFVADDALKLGLVDEIGYLDKAIEHAGRIAGLGKDPQLIVYRRSTYPNDNIYNTAINELPGGQPALIDLGALGAAAKTRAGFYYIWPGALDRLH